MLDRRGRRLVEVVPSVENSTRSAAGEESMVWRTGAPCPHPAAGYVDFGVMLVDPPAFEVLRDPGEAGGRGHTESITSPPRGRSRAEIGVAVQRGRAGSTAARHARFPLCPTPAEGPMPRFESIGSMPRVGGIAQLFDGICGWVGG